MPQHWSSAMATWWPHTWWWPRPVCCTQRCLSSGLGPGLATVVADPRHGPGGSAVHSRETGCSGCVQAQKYLIRSPLALPSPEVQLVQFHEPGIFNYSALLLSENEDTLFVGAREAVFALNAHNISKKQHEVWCGLPVPLLSFSFQHFLLKSIHWALPGVAFPFLAMDHPAQPVSSRPAHQGQGHCYPEAPLLPRVHEPHLRVFPWQPVSSPGLQLTRG